MNKDKKSKWAKIEDKRNGEVSWTEYTDHDGFVYIIYDLMSCPAFEGAIIDLDN